MKQDIQIFLQKALQILRDGGIIIYPTDTAYGIGCRIDDQKAIDRLFALRRRPVTQATPVLVANRAMALTYCRDPSKLVRRLMETYWPGALTIIVPARTGLIYSPIRGGGDSVGLRMPDHALMLQIIENLGVPILGPSANFHGEPTPYTSSEVNPELVKLVDFIIPGESTLKNVSTVVEYRNNNYKILRQGALVVSL